MIYTMNVSDDLLQERGYLQRFSAYESLMKRFFGESELLLVTDTYQFDDYSKYVSSLFDADKKARRREEEFPKDCQKAYDMGVRFAKS